MKKTGTSFQQKLLKFSLVIKCILFLCIPHTARTAVKTPVCALDINPALSVYQTEEQIISAVSLTAGDEFSAGIIVFNISGLDTFQAEIRFDPACLAYTGTEQDQSVSGFLTRNGGKAIQMPVSEKIPGVLTLAAAIIGKKPAESVSGNGPIGILRFRVLKAEKEIPLETENIIFLNSNAERMDNPRIINAVIQPRDITPPSVKMMADFHEIRSPVTVLFSEAVTGFEKEDIVLSNAGLSNFSGNKDRYLFQLIPKEKGEIKIRIPADAAKDSSGNSSLPSEELRLINSLNHPPILSGEPAHTAVIGQLYCFAPGAADEDKTDELSFSIENLPRWANFNHTTGELQGIPSSEDKGTVRGILIRVSDSDSGSAFLGPFDLSVTEAETEPVPLTETDEGLTVNSTPVSAQKNPPDGIPLTTPENVEPEAVTESGKNSETEKNPDAEQNSGADPDASPVSVPVSEVPGKTAQEENISEKNPDAEQNSGADPDAPPASVPVSEVPGKTAQEENISEKQTGNSENGEPEAITESGKNSETEEKNPDAEQNSGADPDTPPAYVPVSDVPGETAQEENISEKQAGNPPGYNESGHSEAGGGGGGCFIRDLFSSCSFF